MIVTFKSLFIQNFSVRIIKISSVNFNFEIADLRQLKEKSFLIYYKRTANLLIKVNDRNRFKKS